MAAPLLPTLTRRAMMAALAAGLLPAGIRNPSRAETGSKEVTWRAAPLRRALRSDRDAVAELWAVNGEVPGPVLRVRAGGELRLGLVNDTPKPLSLHWHGVRGPNGSDGVGGLTQDPIAPGGRFEYRFRPPDSGTFLVRPCVIGASAEPAERGLCGLLIVEEATPPAVDHDIALLIDDWLLTDSGELAPFPTPGAAAWTGRLGNWISVNGRAAPDRREVAPGSRIRLRLANASNARSMRLLFEGLHPYVIAIDGQPTDTFEPLKASLPFAPGSRYDLVLDMPSEAGASGSVVAQIGAGVT
ncbi:MAG: multicopper oxidase family protein, partial [Microvirga sp.]